jgi:hypothetical protein
MIEAQPVACCQGREPRLDLGKVAHNFKEPRTISLIQIFKPEFALPCAKGFVVSTPDRLIDASLDHCLVAPNQMSLADLFPIVPSRVAAEAAPRLLASANDGFVGMIGWTVQPFGLDTCRRQGDIEH